MKTEVILGVPFFNGTPLELLDRVGKGGLIVAPSGPGLAGDLLRDRAYRDAVTTADLAVPDSGFMVLIWNALFTFRRRKRIVRLSGLWLLRLLLQESDTQAPGASFWVMPSSLDLDRTLVWLQANGFDHLKPEDFYVAPDYRKGGHRNDKGELMDEALVRKLKERNPRWIFLNIGSGVQEPLGHWLRGRLQVRPAIICTGAAIAFLTGGQAHIPTWADRFYLGWLFRVLREPRTFLPRYSKAFRLLPILLRCRDRLPPFKMRSPSLQTE